jgi:altronate dehydratase small subunit
MQIQEANTQGGLDGPGHSVVAVWLDARDDVATALRAIGPGEHVRVRCGDEERTVAAREAIALGHKIALRAMGAGTGVRKYGELIGRLTADVAEGEWVHTHNLATAAHDTDRPEGTS